MKSNRHQILKLQDMLQIHWLPILLIVFLLDATHSCSQNYLRSNRFYLWKQTREESFEDQRRRISCTRTAQLGGLRSRYILPCPSLFKSESGKKNDQMRLKRQRRRLGCAREKRRRGRLFAKANGRRGGRNENSDQLGIFESDILLTKDQMNKVIHDIPGCPNKQRGGRATQNMQDKLWPGGLVTYEISTEFEEGEKATIRNALLLLQTKMDSCIRFEEANSGYRIHVIRSSHPCCSKSYVGYTAPELENGVQLLHFGNFGFSPNSLIWHEVLHAVGLWHTQSRSDRDNYVKIIWDNVFS